MPSRRRYSFDELRRMQASLRKRFKSGGASNIVAIGFGLPYRKGVLLHDSGLVATFHVREKREPTPEDVPIPGEVTLRLKRGRKFLTVRMPTDVLPIVKFHPTGRLSTWTPDRPDDFTSGAVVAWRVKGQNRFTTAVVTVRHAFQRGPNLAPIGSEVRIRYRPTGPDRPAGPDNTFRGELVWRSEIGAAVDAAVVTVTREDLVTAQILDRDAGIVGIQPRSRDMISNDEGSLGRSRRSDSQPTFTVQNVLPNPRDFEAMSEGLGPLAGIIIVVSDVARAFEPTTSGSSWAVGPSVGGTPDAAIQVAGAPDTNYTRGAGQSLFVILEVVKENILSDAKIARNSFVFLGCF